MGLSKTNSMKKAGTIKIGFNFKILAVGLKFHFINAKYNFLN